MIVLLKSTYFVFLLCAKCRFLAKKGAPKGKLTLRTSVITHSSKGELALRCIFFIWCTWALIPLQ